MIKNPKKICFTSAKGGIGKTLLSVNTTFYLAKRNINTTLVDFGSMLSSIKYINPDVYNLARTPEGLSKPRNYYAREHFKKLKLIACEDLDKIHDYKEIFTSVITNPQYTAGIESKEILKDSKIFIYDTDHLLGSSIHFARNLDLVFFIVDPSDQLSIDNCADSWLVVFNSLRAGGNIKGMDPNKIKVIANRTDKTLPALNKITKALTERAKHLGHDKQFINLMIQQLEKSYVREFSIPKFINARASYLQNLPIWEINRNKNKLIVFENIFDLLRKEKIL